MSDLQAQLQQAIALIWDGKADQARPILQQVVAADPTQETAWLWLATIAGNNEERLYYLEQSLALNPNNPTAQAAYTQIVGKPYAAAPTRTSVKASGPVSFNMVFIVMVVMFIVTVMIVAGILRQRDNTPNSKKPLPTIAEGEHFITQDPNPTLPAGTMPVIIFTPTTVFTPTITRTPAPTLTPGSVNPTWTPSPTASLTETPEPVTPTVPPTVTETQTREPSETPEILSTATTRPNTRTQTAEARAAQQITPSRTPRP